MMFIDQMAYFKIGDKELGDLTSVWHLSYTWI